MKTMHYRVLMLVAWLVFFYNLERVSKYVTEARIDLLTAYSYAFVAVIALVTLGLPGLQRFPLPLLAAGGPSIFLVSKALLGYPLWGVALPVTVTELCAVLVTGMLSRHVIMAVREFEASIVNFTIKRVGHDTRSFSVEQSEMYQELRRARTFNRPLALLTVEPEAQTFQVVVEKMVEEVQRATKKQYALAALAKALREQLGPYSLIAQDCDRFLVMLPEISREDIPRMVSQVRARVLDSLGLELRVGTATRPEVETFDELVESANASMNDRIQPKSEGAAASRVTSVREQLSSR